MEQPTPTTPASELLQLLSKNNSTDVQPTQDTAPAQAITPQDKQEHRRELARAARERRKQELDRLRQNQCKGITILITDASGKILTQKLSTEAEYIDFVTSVFDGYRQTKQIVDYRVLKGDVDL